MALIHVRRSKEDQTSSFWPIERHNVAESISTSNFHISVGQQRSPESKDRLEATQTLMKTSDLYKKVQKVDKICFKGETLAKNF
jgi:hypothetical protein